MNTGKKDGALSNLTDTHGSDFLIAGGTKAEAEGPLTEDNVEGLLHHMRAN